MSGLIARAAMPMPDISPPPPIGTHQRVEVGRRPRAFRAPSVPCPAMTSRIVERVDEDIALARAPARTPWRGRRRTSRRASTTCAPWPCGLADLDRRGRRRHDDGHRNAEPLAVIGDRLGMVAGRGGDHSARALLVGQLEQFVERAALLVGGGELEVLELQPDLGADDLGQRPADQHRRADDRAVDALRRRRGCRRSSAGCIIGARPSASPARQTMLCRRAMLKALLALLAALLASPRAAPTR